MQRIEYYAQNNFYSTLNVPRNQYSNTIPAPPQYQRKPIAAHLFVHCCFFLVVYNISCLFFPLDFEKNLGVGTEQLVIDLSLHGDKVGQVLVDIGHLDGAFTNLVVTTNVVVHNFDVKNEFFERGDVVESKGLAIDRVEVVVLFR